MKCTYCGGSCDVRPVSIEAQCWECWFRNCGAMMAIWKWREQQRWWRRWRPITVTWVGPINLTKGKIDG